MKTDLPYLLFNVVYFERKLKGKQQVFLGRKIASPKAMRLGIADKLIGCGGEFDPSKDASVIDGIRREYREERTKRSATPLSIRHCARILVKNTEKPWLYLDYALVSEWHGEPKFNETEFSSSGWFQCDPLPKDVPELDRVVLPIILSGKCAEGWALYNGAMELLEHEVLPVEALV